MMWGMQRSLINARNSVLMKWFGNFGLGTKKLRALQTRFELVNQASSDGLWDMSVIAGDPINPSNEFWWSDQFRKMLGYSDERDFPNVAG